VTTLLGAVATVANLREIIDQATKARKTSLRAVAGALSVTRQYLAKTAAGGTMPVDLYLDLCTLLDLDPMAHAVPTEATIALSKVPTP
jgi:hypothetical protein